MAAFPGWRVALLKALRAPVTAQNLRALDAWQRAEGGGARFNPLNTTQMARGASSYNSVGVRNYGNPNIGVQATAQTLLNGRYAPIVGLLRSGRATAQQIGTAVERSPWGTGGGVLRVLGSAPVALGGLTAPPRGLPAARPNTRSTLTPALLDLLNAGNTMFGLTALPSMPPIQSTRPPVRQALTKPGSGKTPRVTGKTVKFLEHFAAPYGLQITATTNGNHVKGSYHYKGRAVDFGGNPANMAQLMRTALSHPQDFTEAFYTGPGAPGYYIKNGRVYPNSALDRSVYNGHHDHVHLAR